MKKFILPIALPLYLVACGTANSTEDHDHAGHEHEIAAAGGEEQLPPGHYGALITPDGAMTSAEFVAAMQGKDSLEAKVQCEIITSCTKKGCWMDTKLADGSTMMVRFYDYSFFVPTHGLEGKKAVLQGKAMREVTDVAALRHYAEDAGKSKEEIEKITEPKEELAFTATGVIITD
ncbi:MAG: DUF4920 domain-containing protein [Flavobacteriales bacterium]